jgi:hypothetical protein
MSEGSGRGPWESWREGGSHAKLLVFENRAKGTVLVVVECSMSLLQSALLCELLRSSTTAIVHVHDVINH